MKILIILLLFAKDSYSKPAGPHNFELSTQSITIYLENSYEHDEHYDGSIDKIINWWRIKRNPDGVAREFLKLMEKKSPEEQEKIIRENEIKIGYLLIYLDRRNSELFDDVFRFVISHRFFINPDNFYNFRSEAGQILLENLKKVPHGIRKDEVVISTTSINYENPLNKVIEFGKIIKENPKRALDLANEIVVNYSTNTSLYNGISRLLMDNNNYKEAEHYLSRTIEIDKNNYDAYTMRAEARYSLKDIKGAIEDIKRASEIDPTNETTKLLSSFLVKSSGFSNSDISYLKNSFGDSEVKGPDIGVSVKGGGIREDKDEGRNMKGDLNNSITEEEKKSNYYLKIGISKSQMQDYNEALRYFNMSIEKNPDNLSAYIERANVYNLIGKYDDAIKDTTYVLMNDPTNIVALNIRAFAMYKKGNLSEAFYDTNRAIEIKPNYADAIFLRALIYEKQKRYDEMLQDLEKASKINSSYTPYFHDALSSYAMQTKSFLRYYDRNRDLLKIAKEDEKAFNLKRFLILLALTVIGGIFIGISLLHVLSPKFTTHTTATQDVSHSNILAPSIFYEGVASGKYKIIKKIGQGGMGSVYLAVDQTLNREVAIKKMNEDLRISEREKQRFIEEARTVAMLHHPNIIEIYTIFEEKGDLYLVFEYINGVTLDKKLDKEVRMLFDEVRHIVNEVSKALSYAHMKGIIHRDLKLSNIMISKEGFVKVMDFGLAKVVREVRAKESHSEIVGSPAYMAPEQDKGMYFKESDLYSLGICIYEMLTGEIPFTGPDYHYQKEKKLYTPISLLVVGLPKGLDNVISKLLEPNPNDRYHSVEEFIKEFNSL